MKTRTIIRLLKAVLLLGGLTGTIIAGLFLYELVMGPHMKVQLHLRAFEAVMPLPPEGIVPVHPGPQVPSAEQAAALHSPVAGTPEVLRRGQVYYQYYCVFCHGADGSGNGPVGGSYMPVPADLHAAKIQSYGDGQLLRAMLTGTGHAPVLARVVPPEHWWPLVKFVQAAKTLNAGAGG